MGSWREAGGLFAPRLKAALTFSSSNTEDGPIREVLCVL